MIDGRMGRRGKRKKGVDDVKKRSDMSRGLCFRRGGGKQVRRGKRMREREWTRGRDGGKVHEDIFYGARD